MAIKYFMKKNVLNIFVDASIYTTNDITYGCPGFCCVTTSDNGTDFIFDKGFSIIENSSNNESELYAILMGVKKAIELRDKFSTINLFSDSKISILTLKEWIFNWYYLKHKNDLLYNASGNQVKNQNIILEIIHTISNNNLNINLYHQKGHVNIKSLVPVDTARKLFKESNNFIITTEEVTILSNYNNFIDTYTRDNLKLHVDSGEYNYINIKNDILHFRSTFNINKYKQLVNYQS